MNPLNFGRSKSKVKVKVTENVKMIVSYCAWPIDESIEFCVIKVKGQGQGHQKCEKLGTDFNETWWTWWVGPIDESVKFWAIKVKGQGQGHRKCEKHILVNISAEEHDKNVGPMSKCSSGQGLSIGWGHFHVAQQLPVQK